MTRLVIEGFNEKAEDEFKIEKWMAWHIAALGRTKKMPKLQEFVNPVKDHGNASDNFKAFLMAHNQKVKAHGNGS